MSSIDVRPVVTKSDQRVFMNYPWELYRGDVNWVPPLRYDHEEMLNFRKHAFYDDAEGQAFLAYRDGKVVGRIHAVIDYVYMRRFAERRGYFGFFESIHDVNVSRALFQTAERWLAERGVPAMRGPINTSMNYECGLLIEGFDKTPTFKLTYNKPYYAELIEDFGFKKTQDLYSFWGHVDMLNQLDKKLEFVVKECTRRFDIKLRQANKRKFFDEARMFLNIYNQALVGTWGFTPLSDSETNQIASGLKDIIVPEMTSVAEVDGKAVGVAFGMLDYNPRIKLIDGRLFPFGFIRLLWNKRAIKKVRLISTIVVPEFQRWGLGVVLLGHLVPSILKWGIQEVEFSWVLESNHLSYQSLKRGGAIIDKKYRIYDYGQPTPYEEK